MAHRSPAYDHEIIGKSFLYLNYTHIMKTQCTRTHTHTHTLLCCQGHRAPQKMACLPTAVERLMGSISSKSHFATWTKQNSSWVPV